MSRFWDLETQRNSNLDESEAEEEDIYKNYRPAQPINDREVIYADLQLDCKRRYWQESEQCDIHFRYFYLTT